MSEESVLLKDVVRDARLRLGLSQDEFGRKVGLSQKAVSQIERGDTKQPKPGTLMRIANLIGGDPEMLFGAVLRTSGGVTLDKLFTERDVPLDVRESVEQMIRLPPDSQDHARAVIDALAWSEQRDFQAHLGSMLTPEWQRQIEKLMGLSAEQQKEVQRYIDWVAERGDGSPSGSAVPVAP